MEHINISTDYMTNMNNKFFFNTGFTSLEPHPCSVSLQLLDVPPPSLPPPHV